MIENRLVLNDDKTELIHFHSKYSKIEVKENLIVGTAYIKHSDNNLGVTFDEYALMTDHISSVCKSASFASYRLGRTRRFQIKLASNALSMLS